MYQKVIFIFPTLYKDILFQFYCVLKLILQNITIYFTNKLNSFSSSLESKAVIWKPNLMNVSTEGGKNLNYFSVLLLYVIKRNGNTAKGCTDSKTGRKHAVVQFQLDFDI